MVYNFYSLSICTLILRAFIIQKQKQKQKQTLLFLQFKAHSLI
jgi:hypothetical protein